jgi:addiction module RelB/DinJ family antitoxin
MPRDEFQECDPRKDGLHDVWRKALEPAGPRYQSRRRRGNCHAGVFLSLVFLKNPTDDCSMTEVFQCRIDKKLVARARQVSKEIGTTPGEVVRLMFAQMVKRRGIPFPLNADSPEDEVLGPVKRREAMWDEL